MALDPKSERTRSEEGPTGGSLEESLAVLNKTGTTLSFNLPMSLKARLRDKQQRAPTMALSAGVSQILKFSG